MEVLKTVVKSEKNLNILEKAIKNVSAGDIDIFNDVISMAYCMIKDGNKLQDVLKEIKDRNIYWNHPIFNDVKKSREEKDDFINNPFQVVEGVLQCKKCGGRRTVSFSKQTRSADEPMTTFATCVNKDCGYKWTYSG